MRYRSSSLLYQRQIPQQLTTFLDILRLPSLPSPIPSAWPSTLSLFDQLSIALAVLIPFTLPESSGGTMPGRTLPTLTQAEVQSHNSTKSCYVTVGNKVYDVTDFLDSHPGGADLILDYAGKDIAAILKDEDSHDHSDAAYEVLDESLVAFLTTEKLAPNNQGQQKIAESQMNEKATAVVYARTGMSCEEDLSKDTDLSQDYKTHKFLDLNKPLLMQVWFGGFSKEFYLEQVHRPRHYKGGASAPIFGNFLEPLSKTPWWMIPTLWLPAVAYGTYLAAEGFDSYGRLAVSWLSGLFIWTLVEYILHRFLFHLD